MANLMPQLIQQFWRDGEPLVGGMLFTYAAGTSTPLVTYQNQEETIENTNPVVFDSNGEANIWLKDEAYKIVLKDSLGNTLATRDNVTHIPLGSISTDDIADGAIITVKIASLAVTTSKLDDDAVTTEKIAPLAVTTAELADNSVTTIKILDQNVTTAKIADGAVTIAKLSQAVKGFVKKAAYLNWRILSYSPYYAFLNNSGDTVTGLNLPTGASFKFISIIDNSMHPDGGPTNTSALTIGSTYYAIASNQLSSTVGGSAAGIDDNCYGIVMPIIDQKTWANIAYGSGNFVANATDGIMYSTTGGQTWINVAPPAANNMNAIAFGNSVFVIVCSTGTNRIFKSTDGGVSWTTVAAPAAESWTSVGYGSASFVAFASGAGANCTMRSTNSGVSWSIVTSPADKSWVSPAYGNSTFVTVGSISSTGIVMRSTDDGASWTQVTHAVADAGTWSCIAFGDGVFIAGGAFGTNRIIRSTDDGLTWTGVNIGSIQITSIAYGNGVFVATGASSQIILISIDGGLTWQQSPKSQAPQLIASAGAEITTPFGGVKYGDGHFIAVGFGQVSASQACEDI